VDGKLDGMATAEHLIEQILRLKELISPEELVVIREQSSRSTVPTDKSESLTATAMIHILPRDN
jgi:hypothetical protein